MSCGSGASGIFPHPADCTKFLNCDNGRTFELNCREGLAYNDDFKGCDYPQNVNCGIRSNTGSNFNQNKNENLEQLTTTQKPISNNRDKPHYGEGLIDVRIESNEETQPVSSDQRIIFED